MRSATRSFLNTPVVFQLLCAASKAFLGCGLALSLQVSAQTVWRGTTAVPPSSGSTARVYTEPSVPTSRVHTEPSAPTPLAHAPAPAASRLGEGSLQMFGVRLSTATREEMRQAIRSEGLAVQREDEAFTEDIYEASNLMPGLLLLKFSYARDSQKLARVDYVFTTFSDNAHAGELMTRIESRFGRPQRVTGREESGPYHAFWRLPDQMEVFVGREWPEKTTYLKFFNVAVMASSGVDVQRDMAQQRPAKAQNPNALPVWIKP
jgi:hypothetical protein